VSETVAFVALVLILVLMVAWGVRARLRERAMWGAYAARHGWRHVPRGVLGGSRIDGPFEGGHVEVSVEMRGNRSQRTRYTRCTARVGAPLPDGFGVAPRGVAHAVGAWVGALAPASAPVRRAPTERPVLIDDASGDAELDRSAVFFARDEVRVRAFLRSPAVRAAALAVVREEASVTDGSVTLAVFGAIAREDDLHTLVLRVRTLAKTLEGAARGATP
jgi:hypothetical protein